MNQQAASNKGWVVTFAGTGINLILGVLYAWGVVKKALVNPAGEWKWSDADGALPFTVSTIAFSIMMIFAGRMQDKIGPKKIAVLGGLMLGAGMILSSMAKTPLAMVITFGIIGGIGVGLGYSATTPPALKWFPPQKKGLIAGIVVAGIGLAAVVMAPLAQMLIAHTSIPKMFVILGIVTIVVVSILAQLLNDPPAGYVPAAAAPSGGPARPAPIARRNVDWAEMLTTPQFWMLWVILALTASAGLMMIVNVPRVVGEQGGAALAKPTIGMQFVMLVAVFNTLGRLVGGFFSDKIGRKNTMVLFFLLQAVNMFCFKNYTTTSLLIFGAAFTGICYGTIFPLFPAATADFYGIKNLGVNYGCVFTAFGLAGWLGPYVAGKIHDATKTYNNAYLICAVMLVAGAVLAAMLRAPKLAAVPAPAPAPAPEKVKV